VLWCRINLGLVCISHSHTQNVEGLGGGCKVNLHEMQNNSHKQNIHHEAYNNIPIEIKFACSLNLIGENQNV